MQWEGWASSLPGFLKSHVFLELALQGMKLSCNAPEAKKRLYLAELLPDACRLTTPGYVRQRATPGGCLGRLDIELLYIHRPALAYTHILTQLPPGSETSQVLARPASREPGRGILADLTPENPRSSQVGNGPGLDLAST